MTRQSDAVYLVVAERLPKGKKRCQESHHGSMSVVFLRQIYKALRNGRKENTDAYLQMRDLAFNCEHPILECSDLFPNANAAIVRAREKHYKRVFLLGKKVQRAFASFEPIPHKSMAMGFPTGRNEKENVRMLEEVLEQDDQLKRQLDRIVTTVERRISCQEKRP